MKKVILLVALLVMVLVTAVPAIASVSNTGSSLNETNITTVGGQTSVVSQTAGQTVDSGHAGQTIVIN